jgi:hypothetical protein
MTVNLHERSVRAMGRKDDRMTRFVHLLGADCSLQTRFVIEVWPFDECWTDGCAL